MPQDRFVELVTKEFITELSLDEAQELQLLLQDEALKRRYLLFRSYLSGSYSDHSSDKALFAKVQQKIAELEETSVPVSRSYFRGLSWKVAAAAIFVIVSVAIFALYKEQSSPAQQLVFTKRAARTSIILSEGTKVVLNSESKLIYPEEFTGKNREVTLVGEAFFDVTKDSSHPFIIHTEKMDVRVLGTTFNVKSYPGDRFSEASLIRGAIVITLKDRPSAQITLKPSEKLIVSNFSQQQQKMNPQLVSEPLAQLTHIQERDTAVVETSWMYNKLAFHGQTFSEISRMLERAYDIEIEFKNDDLKSLKFTGTFEKESVDDVLRALSLVEPFTYKINSKKVLIQ